MGFFSKIGPAVIGGGLGFLRGGPTGAALGAGLGLLGGGGGKAPNPSNSAMPYLNQIPSMTKPYLDPYITEGRASGPLALSAYDRMLNEYSDPSKVTPPQYGQMAQDPTAFVENIMKGYEPSRGYKFKEGRLTNAARNSAASGGFAGTQYDQETQANLVKDLLGEDMQQYLSNILGVQTAGTGGVERGMERGLLGRERALKNIGAHHELVGERGFDAAKTFAEILANNLGSQASLGFQGQRQSNENRNARRGQLFDMIGFGAGQDWRGAGNRLSNIFGGGSGRSVIPGQYSPI